MSVRAGIVVTGTEVLTGRVADANGPWVAERLRRLGVDVGCIVVVGDRRDDLQLALEFLSADSELVITTGGLGPTADDLTAEVVATHQGRTMRLDTALEHEIGEIVARLTAARGWRPDPEASAAGTRKQALVPEGAHALAPVGTAPGLVVPVAEGRSGPPVLVLPGPPSELRGMWEAGVGDPLVVAAIGGQPEIRQSTLRLWGTPESQLAATLRAHDDELAGLEITTCLRGGELEIVARYSPDRAASFDALVRAVRDDFADTLFADDGRTVEELVTDVLLERRLTIATTESCTAGLLAGRLADRPGSSAYLLGGLVTYSNQAKHDLAGVPLELVERVGAVSAEVAEAMAEGARARLGADVGVGITGVAGPGGGTPEKPVGLVHLCVIGPEGSRASQVRLPGSRAAVRERSVTVAFHLLRELLLG